MDNMKVQPERNKKAIFYQKNVVALQNNLISLTDWVDFVMTCWYWECINLTSEAVFTKRYRK